MPKGGGSLIQLLGNMETRNPYEHPDALVTETIQSIANKTGLPYNTVQEVLIEHFNIYIENIFNALNIE
jgi:hypothetical protein